MNTFKQSAIEILKKNKITSEKTEAKKEVFVQKIRSVMEVETLAYEFKSNNTKAFFEVFESCA